jgi:hypothetical protein
VVRHDAKGPNPTRNQPAEKQEKAQNWDWDWGLAYLVASPIEFLGMTFCLTLPFISVPFSFSSAQF